jgi:hypothetical protein
MDYLKINGSVIKANLALSLVGVPLASGFPVPSQYSLYRVHPSKKD